MSYIKHHSIIITGSPERIVIAHKKCSEIFKHELLDEKDISDNVISPILNGLVNSQSSFFVAPDGSKEGWSTSNECDNARDCFISWLKKHGKVEFIEVYFGGDDYVNKIINHSKND